MNLYEAVYARKSVRSFSQEPVNGKIIEGVQKFYNESEGLFGGIETELTVIDRTKGKQKINGLTSVRAPYYLALYSSEQEKYMMNAGYIMQQLALYLCSKGLGSCFVGMHMLYPKYRKKNGKPLVCLLAFGKARNSYIRKPIEARRLDVDELCIYKEKPRLWMNQLLEAGRLAPSSMNSQPWRFVVYDNRIHVFSRKYRSGKLNQATELNFGVLFSNMMTVAEELWLDVDLIKLDEINQKNYTKGQYVLSIILRV